MSFNYGAPTLETEGLDLLDDAHRQTLEQALINILSTDLAETTYAQILDGLPTERSLVDSYFFQEPDHPVFTLGHVEICPGFVDKARQFRNEFDPAKLRFQPRPLIAFQDSALGSQQFNLRLIELVVVACHQIGAYLYELNQGAHSHQLYDEWKCMVLDARRNGVPERRRAQVPPIAFNRPAYQYYEQYPRGHADIAGYWAESKIFGGVFVFDRGESEKECKALWIHGDLSRGPRTLYPPTQDQFKSLVNFLLANPSDQNLPSCPLPIHGKPENRPRWDPYHAFAYYHIFRDRHERVLPPDPPRIGCVMSAQDWPELTDQNILMQEQLVGALDHRGQPYVTAEEVAAAKIGIHQLTPSSPVWTMMGGGIQRRDEEVDK